MLMKMENASYPGSCCSGSYPIKGNSSNINGYGFWSSRNGDMAAGEAGSDPAAQNALGFCTTIPVKFESVTESQAGDADYAKFSKSHKHGIPSASDFFMASENSDSEIGAQNCNAGNSCLHYSNSKRIMCTRSCQIQGKMFDHFRNVERDCVYHRERTELSDVLFSFKASPQMGLTVYPGQVSPVSYTNSYTQPAQSFGHGHGQSPAGAIGSTTTPNFPSPFPAMSVNVSMNMTMGYLPPPPPDAAGLPHHHHQVQWTATQATGGQSSSSSPPPSTSYPAYGTTGGTSIQAQSLCTQPYNTTYSFAADFRSEPPLEAVRAHWIPSSSMLATAAGNGGANAVSRAHHHHLSSAGGCSAGGSKHHFHSYRTRSSASDSPSSKDFMLDKQNLCRICGKTYARPSTLKTHLRTHSGEKPYRCAECYKSFSQAANLTAHVRTHSGEKPFHCTVCDRKFSQSSSVTTHMRTHSGEKPYRCRLCKKAFSDSSTLTKHLRIHSGEKPYQCKLCLLRFSQSGNLNRHMRVHANNNGNISINAGSNSSGSSSSNHNC